MRRIFNFLRIALLCAAATYWQQSAFAKVQISENFDDTNSWGILPWTAFTNAATNVTGWVVKNAEIAPPPLGSALSLSNVCLLKGNTTTSIMSPLLSNGVGSIVFNAKLFQIAHSNQIVVESSTGDGNWTVQSPTNSITNTTSWASFTNSIFSPSNLYLRLRFNTNDLSPSSVVFLDDISINYNPAIVSITNMALNPVAPKEYDAFTMTASLSVAGYFPDALTVTNYWKLSSSTSWTAIPMVSNQPTVFTTISNIPGQQAFAAIGYFSQAVKSSDGISYATNSITNTISILPHSSYDSMVLTNSINAPLTLYSNYQWQGVAYVSNALSTFQFQGTSNSIQTLWGDSNQTISNQLAFGNGNVGASNIILSTTNIGLHLFSFNESDYTYKARPCVRENFDAWTNRPFGNYTNQWILSGGSITNDAAGTYLNSYAILNGKPNNTAALLSPLLTNGIGDISFWYCKGGGVSSVSGYILIQVAPTPDSTNWATIASITNIFSPNYSFVSIPCADLNNQAVRILNNPNNKTALVNLDEVVVAAPGAAVRVSNLATVPSTPGSMDQVNFGVDLEPNIWANITNAMVWYRGASNLLYESLPMILSGDNHYATTGGIPSTVGTVQYAIEYRYSGPLAVSPTFYPAGGTNQPASYTATNTQENYRYETFDSTASWGPLPWTAFTNAATNVTGWVVKNAEIAPPPIGSALSLSNVCLLKGNTTTLIMSPLLSNGVGSIVFNTRLFQIAHSNQIVVESSTGDGNWTVQSPTNSITNTTSWASFTNSIFSPSNLYLRLRFNTNDLSPSSVVFLDDIYCTPYPADIAVTNITLNPGYPTVGQSVMASCNVLSLTPQYEAFNITPTFSWTKNAAGQPNIPMIHTGGNTYTTRYPFILTNTTRDVPITCWVSASFAGYHALPAEDRSPRSASGPIFAVRAFSSTYGNVGISVNGSNTTGRMLNSGLWQAIFTTSPTNSLSFSICGTGFSSGTGIATNTTQWGNTNNWQTDLPLADTASIGQTNFAISGAFSGQYVMRFDESTRQYIILKCVWQDFDNWTGSGGLYKKESNDNTPLIRNSFDDWTTNSTQIRQETFNAGNWLSMTTYTNIGIGGLLQYGIFNSRITSGAAETITNAARGNSFVVQASREETLANTPPLKGIGTISFNYRTSNSNNNTIGVFYPTNPITIPSDYFSEQYWVPIGRSFTATNTSSLNQTIVLNTNVTLDIIFAHTQASAISNTIFFEDISVSEWYADAQTNNGWITSEGWIEPRIGSYASNNCVRFDPTRADSSAEQFIMTPMLTNGINAISFNYCAPSTNSVVSFSIGSSTDLFYDWTPLATMTDSNFDGTTSDYHAYSLTVGTSSTNTYLKIRYEPIYMTTNTITNIVDSVTNFTYVAFSNKTDVLLIDDIKISGTTVGIGWEINDACIDDTDQPIPPQTLGVRQFYSGACYLNSNRTANIASGVSQPYNTWPYLVSPLLDTGIGEVSFWYRNWTIKGAITPASLIIQTTANSVALTNDDIWTTVATLTNIVNTNDYQYYQYSINDATSRYVRIYNDDQYTSAVGRVCIDDVLVAAPLAASLSMSNLVITPSIPLYSNTVKIAADIYKLFLAPSNITLTAYYATATNYAGLAGATSIPLGMSCTASNPSTPGQWYRYQTTGAIPTNTIDTFVKYYVQASYDGYQAASTSPKNLTSFGLYPTWYAPMDIVYGTNQAYYVVYSCPTGSVWINEINAFDWTDDWGTFIFTNEFIELCGPGNTSIKNWMMELVDGNASQVAFYTITNNAIIQSSTNGHGFWLLGVTNVPGTFQSLVTDVDEGWTPAIGTQKLPIQGGIKLTRSWGAVEQAIFYNIDASSVPAGYVLAGADSLNYQTGSLGLIGTGANYSDFSWIELTSASPRLQNQGQALLGITIQATPPIIYIYGVRINTNIWLECTQASGWPTIPYYSTNLSSSNSWVTVPSFYRSTSGTNDLINFNQVTNVTANFYKVVATNSP